MTDTQVMTLTDFLLARISEDEDAAAAAQSHPGTSLTEGWVVDAASDFIGRRRVLRSGHTRYMQPVATDVAGHRALHIARFDPARVLAECAAKRRIVERHTACDETSFGEPCADLRDLAAVYANHPEWREGWRP